MIKSLIVGALIGVAALVPCFDGIAEENSQFRGVRGNGVSDQTFPGIWSQQKNIAWSAKIPGGGWSSPVSSGDRIFVTTAVSDDDTGPQGFGAGVQSMGAFYQSKAPDQPYSFEVHCLASADGSLLWKQSVVNRKPPFKIHPSNSYATESPVTDGRNVFVYFAAVGMVACLDIAGDQVWSRELGAFKTSNDFGTGSSLALHDGKLFVQCDNEEKSFVCALDVETGADVWRDDRDSRTSWSSPVVWQNQLRTELVVCGSGTVTSYDPASGQVLWRLSGTGGAYSASPTFDRQRIYLGQSGRTSRGPLVAISAGASGELTLDSGPDESMAWSSDSAAPGMCSPVVINGHVYVLSRGILSCHDATTGERLYRERLQNASSVTASLWAAGDQLFALNESGETSVVKSGAAFELVSSNSIEGLFWSTPSVTNSALLIRSADKLHCISLVQ